MRFVSHGIRETRQLAARLAIKTSRLPRMKTARVIALEGELGAGKTAFTQAFARALGIKQKVKSPTFVLIKSYRLKSGRYELLYHIDCYRVHRYQELLPAGIREILADPAAIVVIEWPERVRPLLPRTRISIRISHAGASVRKFTVTGH